jgi:alpha-tubulin suppressor-like RCC1 family protein
MAHSGRFWLGIVIVANGLGCDDRAIAPTAPPAIQHTPSQSAVTGFDLESVVTGESTSCGLARGGRAYCWGTGFLGQLGNGTLDEIASVPVPVAGDISYVALANNGHTVCGIGKFGQTYCWGDGTGGTLGDGTLFAQAIQPVPVSSAVVFATIVGGLDRHVLGSGHMCALDRSGQLYCWGANTWGQFGDGTTEPRVAPTLIPGVSFASIVAHGGYTCGLNRGGQAFCAGRAPGSNSMTFEPVPGGHTFVKLGAGLDHLCGITSAGQTLCWGANEYGQLGTGQVGGVFDAPQPVASSVEFTTIDGGDLHTCAATSRGAAYCWGNNSFGQLGDATTTSPRPEPAGVVGGLNFQSLALASAHTCGVTKTRGTWCWGGNTFGQLGYGVLTERWVPSPVLTP